MPILLGDTVPNFSAPTSDGPMDFHQYIKGSWALLFSHPADFTPVCTTELGTVASYGAEFEKRGVKLCALSCNDVTSHKQWIADIDSYTKYSKGSKVMYPIIADPERKIARTFGMIDPDERSSTGLAMTCRAVFIIGPDAKLKLSFLYPATTGRNFEEILRVIDSLQLTAVHKVATPANWHAGESCMVTPAVTDDMANKVLGGFSVQEVPSGKRYIRITKDPSGAKPKAAGRLKHVVTAGAVALGMVVGKLL